MLPRRVLYPTDRRSVWGVPPRVAVAGSSSPLTLSAESAQRVPVEQPLENSTSRCRARCEFQQRRTSFAQHNARISCSSHEPRHEKTEMRLVPDYRYHLGRCLASQPVGEDREIAARREGLHSLDM